MWARTNAEQWGVNTSVHYNNWANLGKEDFEPIAEAFRDLWSVFRCTKCDEVLSIVRDNKKSVVGVRCSCENVNWNLVSRKA